MAGRTIIVKLNQQQLELVDRAVAHGAAADRAALIRRALREQATKSAKRGEAR
jgi:Arc/MetJ-type ribon-helix-helix transcriptional regulator